MHETDPGWIVDDSGRISIGRKPALEQGCDTTGEDEISLTTRTRAYPLDQCDVAVLDQDHTTSHSSARGRTIVVLPGSGLHTLQYCLLLNLPTLHHVSTTRARFTIAVPCAP